jgi:hypothetical protein
VSEPKLVSGAELLAKRQAKKRPAVKTKKPDQPCCHLCFADDDLEPGKSDERCWCRDYKACNQRARRRLWQVKT